MLLLMAHLHLVITTLCLNLIFGITTAGITIQIMTELQQSVENRFLGRTMTTYAALQAFAQVAGMGIISVALLPFGIIGHLALDGLLALLAAGLAWLLVLKKPTGSQ